MEKHKFNIFPDMMDEEYQILLSDLKQNGYDSSQPIHLFQGNILDGWNRYKACLNLNIDPEYIEFEGTEVEAMQFVMRTNKRRNLTSGQWAAIAIEADEIVKKIKEAAREKQVQAGKDFGRGQEKVSQQIDEAIDESQKEEIRSDEILADMFNTNRQYIHETRRLKKENPELFEKVKSGKKTLTQIKKEEKENEEKKETVKPKNIKEIDFIEELVTEMYDTINRRFSKLKDADKTRACQMLIKKLKTIGETI